MRTPVLAAVLACACFTACEPDGGDETVPSDEIAPRDPGAVERPWRGGGPPAARWMPADTPPGWMGPGGIAQIAAVEPEDLPDAGSRGARLVARYCSQCHGIPSPRRHAAADWEPVARRMFLRMEHMARMGRMGRMRGRRMPMHMRGVEAPTAAERGQILAYLQAHAMDAIAAEALPPGPDDVRALFARSCSRCHALPDPGQHVAGEWPGIVARMRAFKRESGVADLPDAEAARIVEYLQANAASEAEHEH
ncbi:MAG: c-type cytochrome [Gemmatimonadota bacterium]